VDDSFNSNPYAPPESINDVPVVSLQMARSVWHRVLLWVKSVTIIVAIGVAYIEIESIIFSGAFYALLAILIGLFGLVRRDYWSLVLSVVAFSFSLSIFVLINIKKWSPTEADGPVQSIMVAYAVFALPSTLVLSMSRYRDKSGSPTGPTLENPPRIAP
jgi:hypothetical protein